MSIFELSDILKKRYLDKAGKDFTFTQKQYRMGLGEPDKQLSKLEKRYRGYKKALSKLHEEDLNEISKKTLGKYIKNASANWAEREKDLGKSEGENPDYISHSSLKDDKKRWNREKYIGKAVDKLTKEENLNELTGKSKKLSEIVNNFSARQAAAKAAVAAQKQSVQMGQQNVAMARANIQTQKAVAKSIDRKSKVYHKDQRIMKEGKVLPDLTQNDEIQPTKEYQKRIDNEKIKQHQDKIKAEIRRDLAKFGPKGKGLFHSIKEPNPRKLKEEDMSNELNELSKKTLGSYINRATVQGQKASYLTGISASIQNPAVTKGDVGKYSNLATKRKNGIKIATDKLTKEDVEQIDEISKNTLKNYIRKAKANSYSHMRSLGSCRNAERYEKHIKKLSNRDKGVERATDKLTKEDVSILDTILNQDPIAFQDAFDSIMTDKVSSIVDEYKQDLAQSMFNPAINEGGISDSEIEKLETTGNPHLHVIQPDKKKNEKPTKNIKNKWVEENFSVGDQFELEDELFEVTSIDGDNVELRNGDDELFELSKKTLGSYIKKAASGDLNSLAFAAEWLGKKDKNKKLNKVAERQFGNRVKGIERATKKLTTEEQEQIDEISKKTLHSYNNKAKAHISKLSDEAAAEIDEKKWRPLVHKRVKRELGIDLANKKINSAKVPAKD